MLHGSFVMKFPLRWSSCNQQKMLLIALIFFTRIISWVRGVPREPVFWLRVGIACMMMSDHLWSRTGLYRITQSSCTNLTPKIHKIHFIPMQKPAHKTPVSVRTQRGDNTHSKKFPAPNLPFICRTEKEMVIIPITIQREKWETERSSDLVKQMEELGAEQEGMVCTEFYLHFTLLPSAFMAIF